MPDHLEKNSPFVLNYFNLASPSDDQKGTFGKS